MELERLIGRARQGDLDAFAEVTQRYQHMAFGYALALLRDLHQAEDVVQEAFVAACFGLARLAEPAAFPGWLRGIVRHQAFRLLRQRHLEALPLSAAGGVSAEGPRPDQRLEQEQRLAAALGAIAQLPPPLREVVALFYLHECSQQDIATFLGLTVTTVNNRLHAARARLKRRTLTMVKDTLEAHQLPDDFAARIGRIVRARGHVVEVLFDPASLPEVLTRRRLGSARGFSMAFMTTCRRTPSTSPGGWTTSVLEQANREIRRWVVTLSLAAVSSSSPLRPAPDCSWAVEWSPELGRP